MNCSSRKVGDHPEDGPPLKKRRVDTQPEPKKLTPTELTAKSLLPVLTRVMEFSRIPECQALAETCLTGNNSLKAVRSIGTFELHYPPKENESLARQYWDFRRAGEPDYQQPLERVHLTPGCVFRHYGLPSYIAAACECAEFHNKTHCLFGCIAKGDYQVLSVSASTIEVRRLTFEKGNNGPRSRNMTLDMSFQSPDYWKENCSHLTMWPTHQDFHEGIDDLTTCVIARNLSEYYPIWKRRCKACLVVPESHSHWSRPKRKYIFKSEDGSLRYPKCPYLSQ